MPPAEGAAAGEVHPPAEGQAIEGAPPAEGEIKPEEGAPVPEPPVEGEMLQKQIDQNKFKKTTTTLGIKI